MLVWIQAIELLLYSFFFCQGRHVDKRYKPTWSPDVEDDTINANPLTSDMTPREQSSFNDHGDDLHQSETLSQQDQVIESQRIEDDDNLTARIRLITDDFHSLPFISGCIFPNRDET